MTLESRTGASRVHREDGDSSCGMPYELGQSNVIPFAPARSSLTSLRSSTGSNSTMCDTVMTKTSMTSGMTAQISQQVREQRAICGIEYTSKELMLIRFSEWTTSSYTEAVLFVLVCIDVVILTCGVQLYKFNRSRLQWPSVCHGFLLIVFLFEGLVRCAGEHAPKSRQRFSSLFHIANPASQSHAFSKAACSQIPFSSFVLWDSFLVLSGIVGACVWGLHSIPTIVPSMLRVSRVTRLTAPCNRFLVPFQILFSSIAESLHLLVCSFCFLVLNALFFSVLAMGIVQSNIDEKIPEDAINQFGSKILDDCLYAFSSLPMSMTTIFTLSIGDQWRSVALPLSFICPWIMPVFILYTFVASCVIVGLVFGTMFLSLQRFSAKNANSHAEDSDLALRESVMADLGQLFEDIDADSSGDISFAEFQFHWRTNPDFSLIMEKLHLKDSEVHIIWDVMDTNRDGDVNKEEFIKFMLRILFDGEKWSRLKTMHCASQAHYRSEELTSDVKNLQDELHSNRVLLEKFLNHVTTGTKLVEGVTTGVGSVPMEELSEKAVLRGSKTLPVNKGEPCNEMHQRETNYETEHYDVNLLHSTALGLMRCVAADQVSHFGSQDVLTFWGGGAFTDKYSDKEFAMSLPCQQCDYFVSHCWTPPKEWHKHFQRNNKFESYQYIKAMELHNLLSESRRQGDSLPYEEHHQSFGQSTVWIDKCCIPQNDKQAKETCVALLEDFMNLSRGLVVILSWQYFTRLWCIYEWACFLRTSDPSNVELGFDAFLKSSPTETLPLYLDSIENLSVRSAQCSFQGDHEILEAKVFQYYNGNTAEESFAAFERFAKCTAICLMAKQLVLWRARTSASEEAAWLEPFRALAERLGYQKLGAVLRRARPAMWFEKCGKNKDAFYNVFNYWFENDCLQYLYKERMRAVRKSPKRNRDTITILNNRANSSPISKACPEGGPREAAGCATSAPDEELDGRKPDVAVELASPSTSIEFDGNWNFGEINGESNKRTNAVNVKTRRVSRPANQVATIPATNVGRPEHR